MNEKKIASRVYEDAIARRVVGGLFQAPPKMLDEIHRWVMARLAGAELAEKEEKIKRGYYNPDAVERFEREELPALKKVLADYPGIRRKDFKRAKKEFKLDLRGWKYLSKLKGDKKHLDWITSLYNPITVVLQKSKVKAGRRDAGGVWQHDKKQIRIDARWSGLRSSHWMRSILDHELQHMAQDLMESLLGHEGSPGTFGGGKWEKEMPDDTSEKIRPSEEHALETQEFYPNLSSSIYRLEDFFRKNPKLSKKARLIAIKHVADALGYPIPEQLYSKIPEEGTPLRELYDVKFGEMYRTPDRKFTTLKKHHRKKWQKAVRELTKALL